jgi:hypothetical protein
MHFAIGMKWVVLGALALGVVPAFGGPITPGTTWYEFDFGTAGTSTADAVGCGDSGTCSVTQNPVADRTNTVPWTFSLLNGGSILVLDLGDVGDRFQVFDNAGSGIVSLGLTTDVPNPATTNPCGGSGVLDITCSLGNSAYSRGTFALGSGAHSITIDVVRNAGTTIFGQAVFQVTASPSGVPEPGTLLLMGTGLVGLVYLKRRYGR